MIQPDLLALLRCPATAQPLVQADAALLAEVNAKQKSSEPLSEALVSVDRRLLYPVRDGIPVLLADEAITL